MAAIKFDNVFDVVTGKRDESNDLKARADLIIAIRDIVSDNECKQVEAAEKLGLTQSCVSDLVNGKIEKFPIDLLMTCLNRLTIDLRPFARMTR
ncbi:helix-turn-helix domain-containing protein [Marinimicrobium sp. ARAG 43.8]|uniref:helix-turn-helix domain-containing protein n=1 Tax=Marinimicrobium sp. ARAG 43.8 TaxID=3418719 RepID=UPI003CF29A9B